MPFNFWPTRGDNDRVAGNGDGRVRCFGQFDTCDNFSVRAVDRQKRSLEERRDDEIVRDRCRAGQESVHLGVPFDLARREIERLYFTTQFPGLRAGDVSQGIGRKREVDRGDIDRAVREGHVRENPTE